MTSELIVRLDERREYRVDLTRLESMDMEQARRWLDDQFIALECEPLRATGKVLLADKVLVVAKSAGESLLGQDQWLEAYARATHAILTKAVITVDVGAMTVTY